MRLLFLAPTFDESNGWGRYASGFLKEAEERCGTKNVIVPDPLLLKSKEPRWKTPFWAILDRNALLGKMRDVNLIHAASETLAPLAMLLSMKTGVPYIVSAHGTYADMRTYRWYSRWLYVAAFRGARAIVPVSTYTERIVTRQFSKVSTVVIPGGIFFPEVSDERKASDAFRILSVGALKPRKGFRTLLRAFARLEDEESFLDIVGDDSMNSYVANLRGIIKECGIEGRVVLHGRVSHDALEKLYAKADLFVLPSEHDGTAFEGLGLVYLEALVHGTPVIGSKESGAEDVIKEGENGYLVAPGDVEALAEKMLRLHGDRGALTKLASQARASVEPFRWEVVGGKMHELYKTCLA